MHCYNFHIHTYFMYYELPYEVIYDFWVLLFTYSYIPLLFTHLLIVYSQHTLLLKQLGSVRFFMFIKAVFIRSKIQKKLLLCEILLQFKITVFYFNIL